MEIKIHAKDLTLSDAEKEYVQAKMEKLGNFAAEVKDESTEIRVEIHEAGRHSHNLQVETQVTIYLPHSIIRGEVHADSVDASIDLVEEKLRRQIERYKGKLHRREGGQWKTYDELAPNEDEEEFEIPKILRRKRISKFVPMHEEEAIEQLEHLGHTFYLFENADTNRVSLIYKREDGFYGIIEPHTEEDFQHRDNG